MKNKTNLAWSARRASGLFLIAMAMFMAGCGEKSDTKDDDEACAAGHTLVEGECVPTTASCEPGHILAGDECVPNTAGCEPGHILAGDECVAIPSACETEGADLGDGSEANPHIICDRAALEAIADAPNRAYALGANIDLSGADWEPIESFGGTLDGRGFEISRLKIWLTADADEPSQWGLFRTITRGGSIKDLMLSEAELTINGGDQVGALAGLNKGRIVRVRLEDARVLGASNVGGLVGRDELGVLRGLIGERLKVSGGVTIGGLVGSAAASWMSELKVNKVEVEASEQKAGGVIGTMGAIDSLSSTLTDVSATEIRVSSLGDQVGGIAGEMSGSSDSQKLSLKDLVISGAGNIGGAIGAILGDGVVADISVTGADVKASSDNAGGVVGYASGGVIMNQIDVSESEIEGDARHVAGVAGRVQEMSTLSEIKASKIVVTGASEKVAGIVGWLWGSTLTDVAVSEAEVKGGESVGGAVGSCIACTSERVFIRDSAVESSSGSTGGIAGSVGSSSAMADVHAAGTEVLTISAATTSASRPTGGIVGRLQQSELARASTHEVHVEIKGPGSPIGGIAGWIYTAQARDVSAHGTVQRENFVGGLIGFVDVGSVLERGHSLVAILGNDGEPLDSSERTRVGPVVGEKGPDSSLSDLYFWDEATAVRNAHGAPLERAEFADEGEFLGWDFDEVWQMGVDADGFERPLLRSWLELAGE